jgi:hypothetical protein
MQGLEWCRCDQSIIATRWHGGLSVKFENEWTRARVRRHPNKLDACNSVARSSSLVVEEGSGVLGLGRSDGVDGEKMEEGGLTLTSGSHWPV